MQKDQRQAAIRNILSAKPISRQSELVRLLRRNGYSVTQASISRDLDELGITKVGGVYKLPAVDSASSRFGEFTISTAGSNLVVLKCSPGFASAIAARIDGGGIEGVVGTIAGDDTVFIAVNDPGHQKGAIKGLMGLFND